MGAQDDMPYLAVKDARIARAGKQVYSREEVLVRGLTPKTNKASYVEMRPPEVVLKNIGKFNNVFFVNDHAPVKVTPDNWKEFAVGVVGDSATVEVTQDNEIFIKNKVVFYDRAAYDDYQAGKVELSASYDAVSVAVDNPEQAGYDFLLVDIPSVDHVALCDKARAGHNARILDSVNIQRLFGGTGMAKEKKMPSLLAAIGISKSKDSAVTLSKAVLDSLTKVAAMDATALATGLEKEVLGVMAHIASLGDSDVKSALVATVADSFKNPKDVLDKKDELGEVLDSLYAKCREEDEKAAKAVLDEITGKGKPCDKCGKSPCECSSASDKKPDGDDKGSTAAKDSASLVDEAVAKALAGVTDSIVAGLEKKLPVLVDASVAKALGQEPASTGDNRAADSLDSDFADFGDASFLLGDAFPTIR
jgi:hypothetical protein